MKKQLLLALLVIAGWAAIDVKISAQPQTTWTGDSMTSNWNFGPNWSNGVPNNMMTARIVGGRPAYPVLDQNEEVAALIVEGGSLNLGTYTLQVNGSATLTGGTISNGILSAANFPQVEDVAFNKIELRKTGAGNAQFYNDVTFSDTTIINLAGTAGPGAVIILGSAAGYDIAFNGDVYFRNQGTNTVIQIGAQSGIVDLNGDVFMQNTQAGSTIRFGDFGTITLADGKAFKIDGSFNTGTLNFRNVTQLGSAANDTMKMAALNIRSTTFGGPVAADLTSAITIDSSLFDSTVSVIAPFLNNVRSSVFESSAYFEKTGGGLDQLGGGNAFYGICEINKSGTGGLSTAQLRGDTFYQDLRLKAAVGAGDLRIGTTNNQTSTFKKNIDFTGSAKGVVFGPGTMLLNGDTTQLLIGSTALTHQFDNLTINNADGLIPQMPINIATILTLSNGIIDNTDTTAVTFLSSAAATGASDNSYIHGLVRKLDLAAGPFGFSFPVGDSSHYAPIRVETATGTPDFEVLYKYNDPNLDGYDASAIEAPIDHISRREYWLLNMFNGGSAYVTLSWNDRSGGVDEPADLLVARWDGAQWVSEGAGTLTGDASAGTIETAAALTSFSPFTLASITALNPLPVSLLYFNARPMGDVVELEWSTATELNNESFIVERSADGRFFEAVATLPGAGISNAPIVYRLTDEQPLAGLSYYRLRQTDFDGKYAYSDIASVYLSAGEIDITVFPMPSTDRRYTLRWGGRLEITGISLCDAIGRIMPVDARIDEGQATIDLSRLPAGLYFVLIQTPDRQHWVKILAE